MEKVGHTEPSNSVGRNLNVKDHESKASTCTDKIGRQKCPRNKGWVGGSLHEGTLEGKNFYVHTQKRNWCYLHGRDWCVGAGNKGGHLYRGSLGLGICPRKKGMCCAHCLHGGMGLAVRWTAWCTIWGTPLCYPPQPLLHP